MLADAPADITLGQLAEFYGETAERIADAIDVIKVHYGEPTTIPPVPWLTTLPDAGRRPDSFDAEGNRVICIICDAPLDADGECTAECDHGDEEQARKLLDAGRRPQEAPSDEPDPPGLDTDSPQNVAFYDGHHLGSHAHAIQRTTEP